MQARVVDERAEETGEGELWLKSDLISGATVLDEDTIRERYIDGWLRTRDVFRVDDRGWYYFVGRVDDMFVCGGENVYPADLERLLATHPAVAEVCVTGLADQALGAVPAAAVVLRPDAHARPAELVAFVRDNAPVYLIPHRIEIVAALPVLGSGKVDRRRVRSLFEDLTASSPLPAAEASVRQQVAEVWAEVLKHEPADPDLSFLDAGGTSSLAVELVARLSALNLAVDVGDVFVKGSVNDLVNQILQERSARQRASTA